jgi:hypothetical protein
MKTFTINSAAELLERDRRTIGRALRGIPADDRDEQGHERWRLTTIIDALSASGRGDGVNAAAVEQILAASEAVESLLERLRGAEDVEAARAVMRTEGCLIGALARALEDGLTGLQPYETQLLRTVRDQVLGAAIGEAMQACNWQLGAA